MLTRTDIEQLLRALNEELRSEGTRGEVYLLGGAVMCLVYEARDSTKDIDAVFAPAAKIREAAARVAVGRGVREDWLNDAVKGFLGEKGAFDRWLDLSHLRVLAAQPEYLLAMKCLAMRLGPEFHDEVDVRFLLRYLNIESYEKAKEVIHRYYPVDRFPQKTLYALEELLQREHGR